MAFLGFNGDGTAKWLLGVWTFRAISNQVQEHMVPEVFLGKLKENGDIL